MIPGHRELVGTAHCVVISLVITVILSVPRSREIVVDVLWRVQGAASEDGSIRALLCRIEPRTPAQKAVFVIGIVLARVLWRAVAVTIATIELLNRCAATTKRALWPGRGRFIIAANVLSSHLLKTWLHNSTGKMSWNGRAGPACVSSFACSGGTSVGSSGGDSGGTAD